MERFCLSVRYCSTKNEVLLFASKDKTTYSSVRQLIDKPEKTQCCSREKYEILTKWHHQNHGASSTFSDRLGLFTGFFSVLFFGLAFTKTGKPSLRNCLLSSHETLS